MLVWYCLWVLIFDCFYIFLFFKSLYSASFLISRMIAVAHGACSTIILCLLSSFTVMGSPEFEGLCAVGIYQVLDSI